MNLSSYKYISALLLLFTLTVVSCNSENETEEKPEKCKNRGACPEKDPIESNRYNVAFLIMDGTFNTELTAPFDIFHHTRFRKGVKAMNVFTVAKTDLPIKTFEGMRIMPDYSYVDHELPKIDILIVPSAEHHLDSDLKDKEMIAFIQKTAKTAKYVVSHCDGAFVLAKAGLLDNKVCTTFPGDVNAMRDMFPKLDIREDVLFVHDGNVITSAGGAKSFEASLYLCELLYGKENADEIAEGMVIDWNLKDLNYIKVD